MKVCLLSIMFLFGIVLSFGQGNPTDFPIDLELQTCLDSPENFSTKGMRNCVTVAIEKWDIELNKNYETLMSVLEETEQTKLKESQLSWIKFRDDELNFSNQLYYGFEGTMWLIVAAERRLSLIRDRAIELDAYIKILESK